MKKLRKIIISLILIIVIGIGFQACSGGDSDDEEPHSIYHLDADNDGYGDPDQSIESVSQPDGYVLDYSDCDDSNADIHPGADEIICNEIDDDCNPETLDCPGILQTFFLDADNDGYGDPDQSIESESKPDGYVLDDSDCDDNDADIHPGADEINCNEIDDDCNPETLDCPGILQTFFLDADNDGYGDPDQPIESELQPDGYVLDDSDCDDNNADIHPGANEIPNGLDDNCNGLIDDYLTPITNSVGMTFNLLSAGAFTMGSPADELGRSSIEQQHEVTLTRDFYMQTTEVTQAQWEAVMGAGTNPSHFYECGANCPVEQVTWFDTVVFCNRLSIIDGLTPCYYADAGFTTVFDGTPPVTSGTVHWNPSAGGYRLPTEAQWEYAARAGSTTAFANGDITVKDCSFDPNLDVMGWYCFNSEDQTHPVSQKLANEWGLYDMHGNLYEWVQDRYGPYPSGSVIDPTGPSAGSGRVFRGGGWNFNAKNCRSAFRFDGGCSPDGSFNKLGFRVALIPVP